MALNKHNEAPNTTNETVKAAQSQPHQEFVGGGQVPPGQEEALNNAFTNYESGKYDQTQFDRMVSMGELLTAPVDNDDASPRVRKLLDGMLEIHEERSKADRVNANIGFIEWDATKLGFGHPCIIVFHNAGPTPGQQDTSTLSYMLLVAEDDVEFDPVSIPSMHQQFLQLPVTVDATLDKQYYAEAEQHLANTIANQAGIDIVAVASGAGVVYRNVDLEDKNNIRQIYYAASKQCLSAITDETILATQHSAVSLGNILRRPEISLRSKTTFKPKLIDPSGLPIHADIKISTQGVEANKTNTNQSVFRRPTTDQPLADVSCMVDVLPFNPQANNQPPVVNMWGGMQQVPQRPPFFANVIITDIRNDKMITLSSALLALSTAMISTAPEVFPNLFKPDNNPDRITYGDIGDCGHNLRDQKGVVGRIPVDSAEFTENGSAQLYRLVHEIIDPNTMISIDVPNLLLGPRAIKTIVSAGASNPQGQKNFDRVVGSLDQLTNGQFSNIWNQLPGTKAIVQPSPIQIPLGYFIDQRDNQRDLREFTTMSAMRWAADHNDPSFLQRWYWSVHPNTDQREGVAERLRLITAMAGGEQNVFVKGYAWRYTINRDFITAVAQATVQTGVAPSFNNLANADQQRMTNNFNTYQDMLVNQQVSQQYWSNTAHYNNFQQQRGPAPGGFFSAPGFGQYN